MSTRLSDEARRLIEEVKRELSAGRNVHVFAVFTRKRSLEVNVTRRLQQLLLKEGIRVEILTADVPPAEREAWYERQLRAGMHVCIAHPKLWSVGLDLLAFPCLLFYETGYSTYTLRQASRRSWRIGQREPIRVAFMTYAETAQESCLRLMGKKLMASLPMEGKLHADGLQSMDSDDDLLTAMARDLVTRQGVGEAASEVWRSLAVRHGGAVAPIVRKPLVVVPEPEVALGARCGSGGADVAFLNQERLLQVPTEATVALMEEFYKRLKEPGRTKVEALRMAKSLMRDQRRAEWEWAGFVLYGDPGPLGQ